MEGKARGRSCGFLKGKFYRKNLSATHDFIFFSRACRDGMGLVHLEKGQKADREVHQSGEVEACHLLQAIVEQAMA